MAILALLSPAPNHGFALKQQYDELLGQEREVKAAQVYSTLARLERDGYCAGMGFEKGTAADRRMFAITDTGVSTVQQWIRTPSIPGGRPSEVFSKVILAIVAGEDGDAVLDAHRELYLTRMREVTARRHEADPIRRLAGDYELAHLRADLEWIDIAGTRLSRLENEL